MTKTLVTTLTANNGPTNGWYTGTIDLGDFDVPFRAVPKVYVTLASANGITFVVGVVNTTTTSWGKMNVCSNAQRENLPITITLLAIQK